MILSFKQKIKLPQLGTWETHFEEKVISSFVDINGYQPKLHTLREDPNNRWQPGKGIHFATGVRSANYNCFRFEENGCKSIQYVKIFNTGAILRIDISSEIFIKENGDTMCRYKNIYNKDDRSEIGKEWLETFIRNDGFDTVEQFWAWFNKPVWHGKIIHWTDLKY